MTSYWIALLLGGLSAAGVYLLLSSEKFSVILGLALLSYAVNGFIFAMGRLKMHAIPIFSPTQIDYADPIPPALVLTAIVIGLAMTALVLALWIRDMAQGEEQA